MTRDEAIQIADEFAYHKLGVSSEVKITGKSWIEPGLMAGKFADPDPVVHGGCWRFYYENVVQDDGCAYSGLGQAIVVMEGTGEVMTGKEHERYVSSNGKSRSAE